MSLFGTFFSHSFVESLERPQIKHDQKAPSAEAVIMACWWNRFSKCSIVHTVFVFALWRASVFSVKRFLQRVLAVFINVANYRHFTVLAVFQ